MNKTKVIKWLSGLIVEKTTKEEIDMIEFAKKCVREYRVEEPENVEVDVDKYFEVLWKIYPRKVDKMSAKKTFEHKIRGLSEEQCNIKCNAIYKAEKKYIEFLEANQTEMQYIKHFATWLNSEVPNSPKYKGR